MSFCEKRLESTCKHVYNAFMMKLKSYLLGLILLLAGCSQNQNLTLNVIHTNDLHSHLLPFNDYANCSIDSEDCLGGFARLVTFLQKEKQNPNTLVLDAGDRFTGTSFYTLTKSQYLTPLFKMMPYDVITLGNHEFDDNLSQTESFLSDWQVPVVVANMNVPSTETLSSLVKPFVILEREQRKIGVIGLLTPETNVMKPSGIQITDIHETLTRTIDILKQENVDIIFVLSHIGLMADKEIAKHFPDIDVIVGGHSHSLLSNDAQQFNRIDNYPIVCNEGKTVVVSVGKGGQFVGKLSVEFDEKGQIVSYQGDSIPMSHEIPNDTEAREQIKQAEKKLHHILHEEIASIRQDYGFTPGTNYCSENCLIGEYVATQLYRAYPTIDGVLLNAGSFRRGLKQGNIQYQHLIEVYPYDNEAVLITLTGAELQSYLVHGISRYQTESKTNELLQTAGVRYTFSPVDKVPRHVVIGGKPLDLNRTYTFLTSQFLAEGGDDYPIKSYQKTGRSIRTILKEQITVMPDVDIQNPVQIE